MKKIFAMMVFACVASMSVVNAQGLFIKAGTGGGFSIPANYTFTELDGSKTKLVNHSYGAGIYPGVSVGYMFNENVGAQLGIDYFIGPGVETETSDNDSKSTTKHSSSGLLFTPQMVITSGGDGAFVPYASMGLILGMPRVKIEDERETTILGQKLSSTTTATYTGSLAFGFTAALGGTYNVSEKIGIFAELFGNALNHNPSKLEIESKSGSTTSTKEYTLVKESDKKSADERLKETFPFSAFGLRVGVKIRL